MRGLLYNKTAFQLSTLFIRRKIPHVYFGLLFLSSNYFSHTLTWRITQLCQSFIIGCLQVGLEINPCRPEDAGSYSCKLTNPLGEAFETAKGVVRKIYQKPLFTQKFTDTQQVCKINRLLYEIRTIFCYMFIISVVYFTAYSIYSYF